MADAYVLLLRHGEADTGGTMVGQRDIPLTDLGQRQAIYWGEKFAHLPVCGMWTSPLRRATDTAHLIYRHLPLDIGIESVEALKELSLGAWEGLASSDVKAADPETWKMRGEHFASVAPAGGESILQLSSRVLPAFQRICMTIPDGAYGIIVAHQAVNRVILASLLELEFTYIRNIPQTAGALSIIGINHVESGVIHSQIEQLNVSPFAVL